MLFRILWCYVQQRKLTLAVAVGRAFGAFIRVACSYSSSESLSTIRAIPVGNSSLLLLAFLNAAWGIVGLFSFLLKLWQQTLLYMLNEI
jgi:hypothetical protein